MRRRERIYLGSLYDYLLQFLGAAIASRSWTALAISPRFPSLTRESGGPSPESAWPGGSKNPLLLVILESRFSGNEMPTAVRHAGRRRLLIARLSSATCHAARYG